MGYTFLRLRELDSINNGLTKIKGTLFKSVPKVYPKSVPFQMPINKGFSLVGTLGTLFLHKNQWSFSDDFPYFLIEVNL